MVLSCISIGAAESIMDPLTIQAGLDTTWSFLDHFPQLLEYGNIVWVIDRRKLVYSKVIRIETEPLNSI